MHLGQQQRNIIYPLRPNSQCFVHFNSISACLKCVQIYANREQLITKSGLSEAIASSYARYLLRQLGEPTFRDWLFRSAE